MDKEIIKNVKKSLSKVPTVEKLEILEKIKKSKNFSDLSKVAQPYIGEYLKKQKSMVEEYQYLTWFLVELNKFSKAKIQKEIKKIAEKLNISDLPLEFYIISSSSYFDKRTHPPKKRFHIIAHSISPEHKRTTRVPVEKDRVKIQKYIQDINKLLKIYRELEKERLKSIIKELNTGLP